MNAPILMNEKSRLKVLDLYKILDTESEKYFDDLNSLAATICDAPMSAISIVDENRQWFKSRLGINAAETSRDVAFCAHTILQNDVLLVNDAREDARFCNNPLVTESPNIRFYAGVPLNVRGNFNLGSLCVIDIKPRTLDKRQLNALEILRNAVVSQLEMRRAINDMKALERLLPMCSWCRNIRTEEGNWQTLNEYLEDSSQLTHGICPSCIPLLVGQKNPSAEST